MTISRSLERTVNSHCLDFVRLTYSELSQPETRHSNENVLLRGVLDITKLDWLTPDGRRVIQEKLNERAVQDQIKNGGARPTGHLTLGALYNAPAGAISGIRVKILVQGIKAKPAVHMRGTLKLLVCRSC